MAIFHLAHFSDLHFADLPNQAPRNKRQQLASFFKRNGFIQSSHNPQRAERAAAWLYDYMQRLSQDDDILDALILSGDLATTGLPDDLQAAQRYVDLPPISWWYRDPLPTEARSGPHLATLKNLADHCVLIPGNHDRYQSSKCEPGGTHFDTVFHDYWRLNADGVVGKVIHKDGAEGREALAVIGVDTCLRDAFDANPPLLGKLGQGYFYNNTMHALEDKTRDVRKRFPDIPVIWVVHFPPHGSIPALLQLRRFQFLKQAADVTFGVSLILSGHTHENRPFAAPLESTIWNAGSATQYQEPQGNWLQLIDIEVVNKKLVAAQRTNLKWQNASGTWDYFQEGPLDPLV